MRQYSSNEIDKLAEALAEAQGAMTHAKKEQVNPFFTTKDKKASYADLPAVIDAAKPHLKANGLAVVQATDFDESGNQMLITTLTHKSGQWMRGYYPLKPVKQDPQGYGSALTYGRRYTFSAIVGVASSDEDDDGNAASGNSGEPRGAAKPADVRAENYKQAKPDALIECGVLADGTLDYDAFGAEIEQAILAAPSMAVLTSIKSANGKTLNRMKVDRPEMFAAVVEVFTLSSKKYQ
jgi:hypothetical protein